MIAEAAAWLEQSGLGQAARGSVWLYPAANLGHVLGAALLVGAIVAFDLWLLRRRPGIGTVARAALPVAAAGLALQFVTGAVLFAAEAVALAGNPAFQAKAAALLLGLANLALFHWRFGHVRHAEHAPSGARPLAAVSLASWITVLLAGRTIAYL